MAINSWITLSNSNTSLTKKFRVLHESFAPTREKMGVRRVTVTGKIDNQVGPVLKSWQFMLKVYETDPTDPTKSDGATSGYGRIDHLRTFFGLNNPGATPSNVITFTEHDDTLSHSVFITGVMRAKLLTYSLTSTNGIFHVPLTLIKTTAEA